MGSRVPFKYTYCSEVMMAEKMQRVLTAGTYNVKACAAEMGSGRSSQQRTRWTAVHHASTPGAAQTMDKGATVLTQGRHVQQEGRKCADLF
jgi:hypothetical protein